MKLTQKQEDLAQLLYLATLLAPEGPTNPWGNATKLVRLQSFGRALRKRFEAACSYEWANTDAYAKRTDKLVANARELFASLAWSDTKRPKLEINRDPRGAALKVTVTRGQYSREFYL